MKSWETRGLGVGPEPHLEGSEPKCCLCAVETTTFSGFRIVTSPASAYSRIVTDSFHIADSRVLGVLSCGMGLEPCRPQIVHFVVASYLLVLSKVGVKMRGMLILSWLYLETAMFYI